MTHLEAQQPMPQGTVKHFDVETATGTVLLDDQVELSFDAETFAASGLRELRLGQRVRFEIDRDGDPPRLRDLNIVSLS
jgi:2-phospho-L-lactate guanylyltransferase